MLLQELWSSVPRRHGAAGCSSLACVDRAAWKAHGVVVHGHLLLSAGWTVPSGLTSADVMAVQGGAMDSWTSLWSLRAWLSCPGAAVLSCPVYVPVLVDT